MNCVCIQVEQKKNKHMTEGEKSLKSDQKGKKNETILLLYPYFLDH